MTAAAVNRPPSLTLVPEGGGARAEAAYDAVLWVASSGQRVDDSALLKAVEGLREVDDGAEGHVHVLPLDKGALARKLVYSPAGKLDPDYDDARAYREAAAKGVKRLLKAGAKKPLIILPSDSEHKKAELVTLLGVLNALYVPLPIRESNSTAKVTFVGVYNHNLSTPVNKLTTTASNLYHAISVARDICEGDPERMSPQRVESYVTSLFKDTSITVNVISDEAVLESEYPLFQAVNRGSSGRHKGRIVFLEYAPNEAAEETLFLVGKGITYDTGGSDLKVNGAMIGMSRDKGGAAAVAGFMALVDKVKPKKLRVVGALCLARNSIGPDAYVSDELIVSRAGVRVRIGNTDAEGRMVMTDVLARVKELAVDAVNPHLYTIATLTGHAVLTVGTNYTIAMDNGVARKTKHAEKLLEAGFEVAEPIEITTLRKEDFTFNAPESEVEDVVQANNQPSSRTPRGHQVAPAFMLVASGLDKHGSGAEVPLKYTHLDIAGSAGTFPHSATGAPILALANAYLL